jgi:hypothetical protein
LNQWTKEITAPAGLSSLSDIRRFHSGIALNFHDLPPRALKMGDDVLGLHAADAFVAFRPRAKAYISLPSA